MQGFRIPTRYDQRAPRKLISLPIIPRIIAGIRDLLGGRETTAQKIRNAIENAGIEFIAENGGGPGVRRRNRQRPKQPK